MPFVSQRALDTQMGHDEENGTDAIRDVLNRGAWLALTNHVNHTEVLTGTFVF